MSGAKAIRTNIKKDKGSVTVETAIILPVFMIALFSIAYIIRIFIIYNTMQYSLVDVARKLGNMSYLYHISGLKEYSDKLEEVSSNAKVTLSNQYDVLLEGVTKFNNTVTGSSSQELASDAIENIVYGIDKNNINSDITELIQTIASNPKAELKLFSTIFAQKLNYEINNKLICHIAKEFLSNGLDERTGESFSKGASRLGIKNGMKGVDFKNSSVFGDGESLKLVVNYSINVPFISEIRMSNQVKYIAWTGGRGESVREEKIENSVDESIEESIWTSCDNNKRYWDRGNQIEKSEVEKITKGIGKGEIASGTSSKYPVIDAYVYDSSNKSVEYYDVFSLNPFMKTFSQHPGGMESEIKKHGQSLLEFEDPNIIQNAEIKTIKRIIILVIPENSEEYALNEYNSAKGQLEKQNIEVRLIKGYGSYKSSHEQTAEAK